MVVWFRWWLVVGGWWLVVSQRVIRVTLRKTFRNHVNEAAGGVPPLQSYLLLEFLGSTRAIARGFSSQQLNSNRN